MFEQPSPPVLLLKLPTIRLGRKNIGDDAVEEPAVMQDQQHAAGEFEQRIFQRAQGFQSSSLNQNIQSITLHNVQ